jgi:hypothetical protein
MESNAIGRDAVSNISYGVRTFWASLTLTEISGAFGDIGTFVPLVVWHLIFIILFLLEKLLHRSLLNVTTVLLHLISVRSCPAHIH